MKKRKRRLLALLVVAGLLAAASVSFTPGRRGTIVDEAGKAIPGAYVFCVHATQPKLFFPLSYHECLLVRTDERGRFAAPLRIRFRAPLAYLIAPVSLRLSFYAPAQHNYCYLDDMARSFPCESDRMRTLGKSSEPVFQLRQTEDRVESWFNSVWLMIYASPILEASGPAADRREFLSLARREYDLFVLRHADSIRDYERGAKARVPEDDWVKWDGEKKPWSFFLSIPWYGNPMSERLAYLESRKP